MALSLWPTSITSSPLFIDSAGGNVTLLFDVTNSAASRFTTAVILFPNSPFLFANAPGGDPRRFTVGPRAVGPSRQTYDQQLQVRPSDATAAAAATQLQLNISLQEIDGNGTEVGPPVLGAWILTVLAGGLKGFRAGRGFSQADLAARVGVSDSTISRIERGRATSPDTAQAFHEAVMRLR